MASASVAPPDSPSSQFSFRYRNGTIPQSLNRPTMNSSVDLLAYFIGQEWRDEALCDPENNPDLDPNMFFPDRGVPGEAIRNLCFSCPVRNDCLEYSVTTMPKFGWFGGHPEDGRKAIRRLMRKGMSLEQADAKILADALSKIRQRKTAEKGRLYDSELGDVVAKEIDLAAVS